MPYTHTTDRLSAEDAVFFYVETKDMPLHIAGVMMFDGPISVEACRDVIESRLPELPRYRQRVIVPPFNIGHPTWEWDPAFDINKHIRSVRLKRGTKEELQDLVRDILSEMMDRSKPLWDMTLVDGFQDGGGAMIARIHHCLADGIAGIALLNLIFDPTPRHPRSKAARLPKAPPLPDPINSLLDGLVSCYSEMLDRVVSAHSMVLNITEALVDSGTPALDPVAKVVPEILAPVERLPFNKPCHGARKLVWTDIPLEEVMAIRQNCGVKVNDIVMTALTGAMRRYALLHRQSVKDRLLRLFVPVSLRSDDHNQSGLGNRISILPVNIPMDIRPPLDLLREVHARSGALKGSTLAEMINLLGNWIAMTPAPLQAALGPYLSRLPFPVFNMVCTNVPGPPVPLYFTGRKMLATYPYVPIGVEMGVCCAVESYDGKLFFGFTGSEAAAPDVDIIPVLLDEAYAELRKAAGVAPLAKREPARAKPVRKAKPAAAKPRRRPAPPPSAIPLPQEAIVQVPVSPEPPMNGKIHAEPAILEPAGAAEVH